MARAGSEFRLGSAERRVLDEARRVVFFAPVGGRAALFRAVADDDFARPGFADAGRFVLLAFGFDAFFANFSLHRSRGNANTYE